MNNFEKFNRIRNNIDRNTDFASNVPEVSGESGFKCLHILWLYPDVLNIHGGRGDVMGLLHISNVMGLPVEIRRWDNLSQDVDWSWPHLVIMTAGELKCACDVVSALRRQIDGVKEFLERKGTLIANGSSGAVLADSIEVFDGLSYTRRSCKGLGLLDMSWKERESVWGDDIWLKTESGTEIIGNQIQVADITLGEAQAPFGEVIYGRGNNDDGQEGARTGNVIYTGVLGPLITKNPELAAELLTEAAENAGIDFECKLTDEKIEIEKKSAEYIRNFMNKKMEKDKGGER